MTKKTRWLPYIRSAYYASRSKAFTEARRLRKTRQYRARVMKTTVAHRFPWTLWTSRRE